MLSTIEVIVEKDGSVHSLEPLHPDYPMRALLTLLEPIEKSTTKRSLHEFVGILENSDIFSDDPVTLQRKMRDEWE